MTRPREQAANLCGRLADLGATPVRYPVLEIFDIEDIGPLQDAAIRLEQFDLVVFVSPNAVVKALDIMLRHRRWPTGLAAAAMGRSSECELAARGVERVISPKLRFDSEALLEAPDLQDMQGKRVLICRGDGGRELLGETLTARGAAVEYLTVYRRGKPDLDPAPLLALWETGRLDAVTLTSSEGLRHMVKMVGHLGHAWLKKTPTFVPHARISEQATRFGLRKILATGPGDDGLIDGMLEYFAHHGQSS